MGVEAARGIITLQAGQNRLPEWLRETNPRARKWSLRPFLLRALPWPLRLFRKVTNISENIEPGLLTVHILEIVVVKPTFLQKKVSTVKIILRWKQIR